MYLVESKSNRPASTAGASDGQQEADFLGTVSVEEWCLYHGLPRRIEYIFHPSFDTADAEERLFGPQIKIEIPQWNCFQSVGKQSSRIAATRSTVLSPRAERILFLRYNYARYRLSELTKAQAMQPTISRARQMENWLELALESRNSLVEANMGLVLGMTKRSHVPNVEFCELVSEGSLALIRSVDKFDVSRGYKFSTYACRVILQSFRHVAVTAQRYWRFFPVEFKPQLQKSDCAGVRRRRQWKDSLDALREVVAANLAKLTDVERTVVADHFGLYSHGRTRSFARIAKGFGLSGERMRQIHEAAIGKIRWALEAQSVGPLTA